MSMSVRRVLLGPRAALGLLQLLEEVSEHGVPGALHVHTQLLRLARGWLLGEHGNEPAVQGRAQSVITLASELRLATRES